MMELATARSSARLNQMAHLGDDLRGVAEAAKGGCTGSNRSWAHQRRVVSFVRNKRQGAGACARQGKDWRVQMRQACRRWQSRDLEVVSGDVDGAVYFPHVRLPAAAPSPQQHQVGTIAGRQESKRACPPQTPRT